MEVRAMAQENTGKVLKSFAVGLQFAFFNSDYKHFSKNPN
jgi:hypothetical protein